MSSTIANRSTGRPQSNRTGQRLNCFTDNFLLVLIFVSCCLANSKSLLGQGNVTFTITNRGDLAVVGDNFDNRFAIYLDDLFPQDLVIEGLGGTTITLVEPGFPTETADLFFLDRFAFDAVRNLTIDLKQGGNQAEIEFLPPVIFGNFRVNLGRGRNVFKIFLPELVEVRGSIDVRGSRTAAESRFQMWGEVDPILARQAAFDLGGDQSTLNLYNFQTSRNFSVSARGNDSSTQVGGLSVAGQTRVNINGSDGCFFDLYFSDLFGRTSIRSRGNNTYGIIEDVFFNNDLNLRMGNTGNLLEVCFNDFWGSRKSRFQAGRGINTILEIGNQFLVPPDVRGFTVEDKSLIPF